MLNSDCPNNFNRQSNHKEEKFSATDTSLDKTASYQASLGGKNLLVNLGN